MSARRRTLTLALALAVPTLPLGRGYAQDADKRAQAEALNAEGKKLIKEIDLEGAAARFRAARQLVDDPRYAFNLCYTLDKSGKLPEARVACSDVVASGDPRLGEKAAGLLETIDAKLAAKEVPVGDPAISTEPVAEPRPEPPIPPATPVVAAEPRFAAHLGFVSANVDSSFDSSPLMGLAAGGSAVISRFTGFAMSTDAQFVQRGFSVDVPGSFSAATLRANYLDVGVHARYLVGRGRVLPYLELGSVLSILLSSSASIEDSTGSTNLRSVDFAYCLGGGLRVGNVDVRIRQYVGVLDINGSAPDATAMSRATNRATSLQVGYWF